MFAEFKDLAFWVQDACWYFRCRGMRWMCLWDKVLVEVLFKESEFPGFVESVDEFAILVDIEQWPPGDLQLLTFVFCYG